MDSQLLLAKVSQLLSVIPFVVDIGLRCADKTALLKFLEKSS